MSIICPKCGAELPDDSVFCDTCGATLNQATDGSPDANPPASNESSPQDTDAAGSSEQPRGTQGSFPTYGKTGSYNASANGSPQSGNTFGNSAPQQNINNNPNQGTYGGSRQGSFNGPGPGAPYSSGNGVPNGNFNGNFNGKFNGNFNGNNNIPNNFGAPGGGKNPGGIPKAAFIGAGVLGLVVIGVVAALLLKNKPKDVVNESTDSVQSTTVAESDVESTTAAKEETTEATSESSVKRSGDDKDIVIIPSGAKVKTDAEFSELIGEYEGEIQLTALDGFEDVEGIPEDFEENRKEALSNPLPCTLIINEDGDWGLEYDFMGGMGMDSTDFNDPDEFTKQQRSGILVDEINDGYYHAGIDAEGAFEGDEDAKVEIDHVGAYCTKDDDSLIAGYYYMHATTNGAEITVCGDFNVKKLTEDVEEEETTESEEQEEEEETIPTISGGQWTKMKSGAWIYEKDGRLVKNCWVESKGKYYYIDKDGYMMTDGYTPDGYYVKKDGSWDSSIAQRKSGSSGSVSDDTGYDPTTYAVTGGKFETLEDGAVLYEDSKGKYVSNTWVESKGKYYFIGPDGTRISNNYSSDGYWTDANGKWCEDVPQRTDDPEPLNTTYSGVASNWKIKLLKNGTYGTATYSYNGSSVKDVYTLTPLGHGVYLAELDSDPEICALMTVSGEQKYLIVSQAGITEECKAK